MTEEISISEFVRTVAVTIIEPSLCNKDDIRGMIVIQRMERKKLIENRAIIKNAMLGMLGCGSQEDGFQEKDRRIMIG